MRLTWQLFTVLSVVNFCRSLAQSPQPTEVISLKSGGKVRGFVQSVDVVGNYKLEKPKINVSSFIGIPYATSKRFEKPVKLSESHWSGVQEVTKYRFACPQENLSLGSEAELSSQPANVNQTKFASENCLFLNVWSPQSSTSSKSPLAVMVWIHDGTEAARDNLISRSTIFSKVFDGKQLAATGNVVVITVGYRVGVFGYLFLGGGSNDSKENGQQTVANFGLYDQIEALKWVQENVHLFNGDPKRVTIFGDSGGGAVSVGILVLSPKTDGLFQRAILQSGSPLAVVDDRHSAAAKTRLLGSMVGCSRSSKSSKKLISCLQTKPTLELLNASLSMAEVGLHFRPVFGEKGGDERENDLLPSSPLDLLLQTKKAKNIKKIDLLFGITANEGAPAIYDLYPELDVNESLSGEEAEHLLSNLMHLLRMPYLEEVLDFYLDDLTTSSSHPANESELRRAIENVYGDLTTVVPTILFAQLLHKQQHRRDKNNNSRFFAYHLGQPLPVTSSSGCLPWMGVCSGSTIEYIFGINAGNKTDTNAIKLSRTMMVAWAGFAESGEPKLPKDMPTSKTAAAEMIKWKEAFPLGSTDNKTLINFMDLKVDGGFQNIKEDLLLNNEHNCSEIAFWADKLIGMYSTDDENDD